MHSCRVLEEFYYILPGFLTASQIGQTLSC